MPQHEPTLGDNLESRLDVIADLLDQGMDQAQIVKFIREHDDQFKWGISDRQVRNYVHEVLKRFAAGAGTIDRRAEYIKSLRRYERVFRLAAADKEWSPALSALSRRDKLMHLDNPAYIPDWQAEAAKAGISPNHVLIAMLESYNEQNLTESLNTDE